MGSRISVVVAVIVAVLVASGALAFGGNSHMSRTTRLAVQIETQKLTVVDAGPTGSSPGDMIVEEDNLTRQGKSFGTAQITCIAHAGGLANDSAECSGTFYLPKGQIETQGVRSPSTVPSAGQVPSVAGPEAIAASAAPTPSTRPRAPPGPCGSS
jgi:hypothetical protein